MSDFFEVHEVTPRVTRITDVADTHFYLVRGEHDAALLDTGVGCGDLKALVSKLTDLPVTVLITHGHVDHAFGAGQFERAYMSPLDRELYAEHGQPETRLEYIHHSAGADTSPKAVAVTEAQLQPPKPFENFFPLTPGTASTSVDLA